MPEFIPVLKKDDIGKMVDAVARKISSDYKDKELILIGVLKGSFVFLSDLIRNLSIPVKIDFVGVSSYSDKTSSSGKIQLTKSIEIDIKNKNVLVVEDIVDSGLTLAWLIDYLMSFEPKTVNICTLLDKRERRETQIQIDYTCHVVQEGFLVGYGLDYAEDYRNLPEIYHLKL
ncbi:MAG: hypoxanthine phosphoribosyltransferase [Desulfobacteraceae bacterium 4572_187]|nr:MAG: hypoxanthine phosphoribosyltransferase [Desulfobacteraceae bacterium 4572_187]